ncbi:hypothetical protein TRVA0_025S00276 [Trichomonascus vanleenenianus]|uniref:phosphotransferase family protein n=1 Tax=Trichomonascus vanleenenianus TaxID=2268995 RepID=UPI003ECAA1F4
MRVSRPALPGYKTENEVACLKWVKRNVPSCPVPDVVAWSSDTDELGYEYVLLSEVPGEPLANVWRQLSEEEFDETVVDRLVGIFVEAAKHTFTQLGGLVIDQRTAQIVPGPLSEEVGYETPHIKEYWDDYPEVTFDELQVGGPFNCTADYIVRRLERDLFVVLIHDNCKPLRGAFAAQLERVINLLTPAVRERLNSKRLVLAHQDLHLGNLMYDVKAKQLSGIIDWEFSGIAPIDQWVRRNTFAVADQWAMNNKYPKWRERFYENLKKADEQLSREAEVDPLKDVLGRICSLSFWIVNCTVTKTQADDVEEWLERLDTRIKEFYDLL